MKEILRPSVPGLKGKTGRKQKAGVQPDIVPVPNHIQDYYYQEIIWAIWRQKDGIQPDVVTVPKHMHDYYQEIILAIDIMHVNQIPFLITTSRQFHYHTASVLPSMNGEIIVSALWALYKLYLKRNF